jgi:hypothetical protein
MKLTEWYPYSTKPVREGVYETNMSGRLGYSYWTGTRWSNQSLHAVYAERSKAWLSGASQKKNWRGLAEPPAAPTGEEEVTRLVRWLTAPRAKGAK